MLYAVSYTHLDVYKRQVLERFGDYTYMQFKLETGRTHQIRVHMASINHPLLGDMLYSLSLIHILDLLIKY